VENHEIVIGIYFDLNKAFYTVDYEILLYVMFCYGVLCMVYVVTFICV